jgi:hypothetical protein
MSKKPKIFWYKRHLYMKVMVSLLRGKGSAGEKFKGKEKGTK